MCWILMWVCGVAGKPSTNLLVDLLWVALIYPLLEEVVFRGGLQPGLFARGCLHRSIAGISAANIITSVLFAALHLFNQPALWAALIFFPSLVFGWARDRYGNITASIVLHMFYNAGFVSIFLAH